MLKYLADDVWVYDAEWVPDPPTGRAVYRLPLDMPDRDVIDVMYAKARERTERNGKEAPERPFIKTALCRIVAITAVKRHVNPIDRSVSLELKSLPTVYRDMPEREIVDGFLTSVGKVKPQLVGFSVQDADLPILLQRAVAHQLYQPRFDARPNKPWEGVDYFAGKYGHDHADLKIMLSGFGHATPSLHEICVSCGIPGKLETTANDVLDLWLAGDFASIVRYGCLDVLSTYQLLLRVVLLAGLITPEQFHVEQDVFDRMLATLIGEDDPEASQQRHLSDWMYERQRLRHALAGLGDRPKLELVKSA